MRRHRLLFAGAVLVFATGAEDARSAPTTSIALDHSDGPQSTAPPETDQFEIAQLPMGQELYADPASPTSRGASGLAPLRQGLIARYEEADLAHFAARTALDFVQQLPGFTIEEGASVRGLLGGYGNVLVNGRALNSKAESLKEYLGRTAASQVQAIEVMDASASNILAHRQGLVANVITKVTRGRSGAVNLMISASDAAGGVNLGVETQGTGEESEQRISLNLYQQSDRGPIGDYTRFAGRTTSFAEFFDRTRDRGASGQISIARRGDERRRLELTLNGAYDRGDSISEIRPTAAELLERYRSRYVSKSAEVSGVHATPIGDMTTLETTALHSKSLSDTTSSAESPAYQALSDYHADQSETVLRTTLSRRTAKSLSLSVGVEAAFNNLDGRSSYVEANQAVILPSQDVRVRERRGEAFARFKGPVHPNWIVDLGLSFEASTMRLRGAPSGRVHVQALKPDATVVYSPDKSSRIALSLSRRVGQLDFSDFVTSVGLEERTVALGAPRLDPVRRWRFEGSYNLTFNKEGALNLTLAGEHVDNPQELIPIAGQDAPGNLQSADRHEASASVTLPLKDIIGVSGTSLSSSLRYQHSKVRDPVTGRNRRLSGEARTKGEFRFRHDIGDGRISWGADMQFGSKTTSYRLREIKTYAYDPYWGVDLQYRPSEAWSVRFRVQGGGDYVTARSVFNGQRDDGAPALVERRAKRGALLSYLTLRREM